MIKFLDIQKITALQQSEINAALTRVAESGWYIQGKELATFESEYAGYIGTKHCVGCGTGLDAISLILRASIELGTLSEGDEILVPANTFIATILAITENRLKPVFIDANEENWQIDDLLLEQHITPRSRALLLVHLYGQCAYTEHIRTICERHNLLLIEDNAQAHGCQFAQQKTGSLGYAAAHSFYPGKNLGALGDGGAITTNNDALANTIRSIANYGQSEKYVCTYQGVNSRLDEIQAAVLSVKLKQLDNFNNARRTIAEYYREHIKNQHILIPAAPAEPCNHVYHLFPVRCKYRSQLQAYLKECGIETGIHYPIPPHRQHCYSAYHHISLPVTEQIHDEELSLPISPVLTIEEARRVVEAVNSFKP